MANRDITESGVQEVLRTMGIPSSFKGFREDVTGRAEALATVGSGMAGTMAGMGGGLFEMLRSGNPQAALDQYRQIQEAMTFVPRTQKGLENVQDIGEFFEPVANIYEQFGEGVAEQTGSPVVGEFAQEFVDPLDLMGLSAVSAIPAIAKRGAKTAAKATDTQMPDPSIRVETGLPDPEIDEIAEQVLRLYHASPADFDEFSLDFIGTGEGAQAYGQGLYFAEANKTADYYYEMFNEPRLLVDGVEPNTVWTQGIRERFSDIYDELYDDAAVVDFKDRILSAIEAEEYDIPRVEERIDDLIDKVLKGTEEPRDFSFIIAPVDEVLQENYGVSINDVYDVAQTQNEMDSVLANLSQANSEQDLANLIESSFTPSEKRLYRRYIEPKIKIEEGGAKMYEVDVKVKDDELLDWDKPFKDQPKKVQDAVKKALGAEDAKTDYKSMTREELQDLGQRLDPKGVWTDEASMREFGEIPTREDLLETIEGMDIDQEVSSYMGTTIDENEPGRTLYERIVAQQGGGDRLENAGEGPRRASQTLKDLGLKGIRYADGMSRKTEDGTSNFVIFDPRIIKIAKKYGVAIPVAGMILLQAEQKAQEKAQQQQAPVA